MNSEYRNYIKARGYNYCNKCEVTRPLKTFGINKSNKNGLSNQCKFCRNYRVVSKRYGLVNDELKNLFQKQENKCLICQSNEKLAVDHCHKTGKVRGLLCNNCNNGLGRFRDNIEFLEKAISYLRKNYE